ncbi:hypothetical protein FACS1894163_13300 [Spirochaetia bacterium]|nr:hypothetical protein FACS1894163_13300 [Spirochaetia bacterium]
MEDQQDKIVKVYCPHCEKITNGVSLNLLKDVKTVYVDCPKCGDTTVLEYDDDSVSIKRL